MKKYLLFFTAVFALPVFLIACGNSKSGTNQYASSPTNTACLYGVASCDNSVYNQYGNYGFQAYPGQQTIVMNPNNANRYDIYNNSYYNNGSTATFCSCPVGSRPVFNGSIGLGCVSFNVINPYVQRAYYWGDGQAVTSSNSLINWNQISNIQGGYSASGCYSNLAWSCFVDAQNSCFTGSYCQQLHNDSRLGLCVRQ